MHRRAYDPNPCYPVTGGEITRGWSDAVAALPSVPLVLAVDGPAVLDWDAVVLGVSDALRAAGTVVRPVDVRHSYAPWAEIVAATTSPSLADDPDFERLAEGDLDLLFAAIPTVSVPVEGVALVHGPGAALVQHDALWYVDLPKRYAEAAVAAGRGRNLGQGSDDGVATTRRLFYVDWPLLDRHRDSLVADVDRWVDLQDATRPASVDGALLRRTLKTLAGQAFRTRPTFNTTPWGGRWAQRELGFNKEAPNTALGYELIAPESGVLAGDADAAVELPFQLVVAAHSVAMLGAAVQPAFGTSFPIRFDYLDTVDGGNLSVHCHPQPEYMSEVFGWAYPQHETYYLMVGSEANVVFLGLRDDVDVDEFHRRAHEAQADGVTLPIEEYVQTFPAEPHRLFCVPAGTPHGSGEGNVVLEVSATPYLYSLRFYDWLRRGGDGQQRPVHVGHAFDNLDTERRGAAVRRELVQAPRVLRSGDGWREELLGALPEMFYEVRRIVVEPGSEAFDDTTDHFHVLNVVEGDGVEVVPEVGPAHDLAYAETLVVPASVGPYRLRALGADRVRVVKSLVR